ncbi:hypothetical protein BDB00DRAFT_72322 [Zychaea mexicana]|uniref:uncharacterized protein n=1 Tax=Zychaea mexicana TaxID=64656 RepID=UPI0022FDC608|nr:uncharacterized protein BDB00DRAFT_72322 [Zychaea mexicana]KAI9496769.1 hypothetical protein BDB00DRAFT_72322 [Zychaea mexicana]
MQSTFKCLPLRNATAANVIDISKVCSGRGRSYCLIHRRYFETSWCPDCSRSSKCPSVFHLHLVYTYPNVVSHLSHFAIGHRF